MNRFKKHNDDSIEITGNMNLGLYSPLELCEGNINESMNEISTQTAANYLNKTKEMRRDIQFRGGVTNTIKKLNDKYKIVITNNSNNEDISFLFRAGYDNAKGFVIVAHDFEQGYETYLNPENPKYNILGEFIEETPIGYAIDNMKAWNRARFKQLCAELNILNGKGNAQEETINEKAESKAQQRLMGAAYAYKKGETKKASPTVKKLAKSMTTKELKDFAGTKHKGLPNHVDESKLRSMIREGLSELDGEQFSHQLGPDGDVVYGKDEKGFFVYIKKNMGLKYFDTADAAEEFARKVYKAIRVRKDNDRREFDRQISMDESAINELSDDTIDSAYMKIKNDVVNLPNDDPKKPRRERQFSNVRKMRNDRLGFDPFVMKHIGTSGNDSIDRKYSKWQQNHDDREAGKRTYNPKTGKWATKIDKEYSTQGGMTTNDDIKTFKRFIMQYPDLPECSWLGHADGELQTNEEVLRMYEDLSRKIWNALPEETTLESYKWLCNCWTFVKRKNEKNANFCYRASIKFLVDALSKENLYETVQAEIVKVLTDYTEGKTSAEKANKAIMDYANSSNKTPKKRSKVNESAKFDDEMAKMEELARDDFYKTLKQLMSVVEEESIIDAVDAISDYPTTYCVYGSEPEYEGKLQRLRVSITKSIIRTLENYDVIYSNDEAFDVNIERSNVPQAAELCIRLKELCKEQQQPMNESYAEEGNYTHFAVNKETNKIVNGWDYSDHEPDELRMYKKDYFFNDLEDNDLNPKQYTILTVKGCKKRGIDPFDNSQWANN